MGVESKGRPKQVVSHRTGDEKGGGGWGLDLEKRRGSDILKLDNLFCWLSYFSVGFGC